MRERIFKFMHKKTAYDSDRRQLDRTILENILFADNSRNGGK